MNPTRNRAASQMAKAFLVCTLASPLSSCKMKTTERLPEQSFPLFNPHRTEFVCQIEATKVPKLDAEAEQWFLEAQALEDPNIYEADRDYKRIVQLTRQAADRLHWKAMLNLASLYLENRDPPHGVPDAIRIVREAMRLGIPAAFDRLGTYYLNGVGVGGVSEAYALFQKAAEMGNPQSMTFLGQKMNATWDSPHDGFWANIPIATKMLECAIGQGDGNAASQLYYIYQEQKSPDAKARALRILHKGAKLGCADCANHLQIEFEDPSKGLVPLAPFIDMARSERYRLIGDALSFNPKRRYPNLDSILPHPPANLPPWDGKKQTLLDIAAGVTLTPSLPPPSDAANRQGRFHLDSKFSLAASDTVTTEPHAPSPGFWQRIPSPPAIPQPASDADLPRFYQCGEPFAAVSRMGTAHCNNSGASVWTRFDIVKHNQNAVDPQAALGITRIIPSQAPLQACSSDQPCPATGIWQPWVDADHPMSGIVNQPWRQAWRTAGEAFPHPERDWLLPLANDDVQWHLLEQLAADQPAEAPRSS